MGPLMQYVDEFVTNDIELRIAPFCQDGKTEFNIPVNDETIKVKYIALKREHTVQIEKCEINFSVIVLGNEEITLA